MKPITTIFLLAATITVANAQTIRRVNADPTVTGTNVYQTLQAAHDAAAANDVIIVEPGSSVGDLTCTKALTIYGRGYFLDKNPSYSLANNSINTSVGTITISANNVKLYGLASNFSVIIDGVSNITIARCYIGYVNINGGSYGAVNNVLINQNYFQGGTYGVAFNDSNSATISNVTITNNLFSAGSVVYLETTYSSNIFINQNTVVGGPSYGGIYNALCTNNIFTQASLTLTNSNSINTTYNNNAFTNTSTVTATGANNIFVANLTNQFVTNSTGSSDNGYRIINGSPLLTGSTSGGELGMFGGATPYVQYGIPAGPALLKLNNTGLGNSTTPITVTTSAVSNN